MGCTLSKEIDQQGESAISIGHQALGISAPRRGQLQPMSRRKALLTLNSQIEKELIKQSSRVSQKALFLGTGESGKSTVFKQMRLCYANSFDNFERYQYSKLIWADTLRSMRVLVDICEEELRSNSGDRNIENLLSTWVGNQASSEVRAAKCLLQSLDASRKGFLSAEVDSSAKAFLHSHVSIGRDRAEDVERALLSTQAAQPIVSQAVRGYVSMGEFEETNMGPLVRPPLGREPTRDEIAEAVNLLWSTCPVPVKRMVAANQVGFNTNAAFFLDKIMEMRGTSYLATDDDILRARIKTTGITTASFRVKGNDLVVMDVGGQRIERSKWIHGFDDVTCLLFVASVSEYDQSLDEDTRVNRLDEALETFKQTVNSQWFRAKSVQLFLNKTDILERKCMLSPFSNHFPNYKGSNNSPEQIITYIEELFRSRFKATRGSRALYVHRTCATDTTAMKFVVNAVSDMILLENLKWAGMI